MDLVLESTHIPRAGETIIARSARIFPGGKGANQAVAIARLSGEVVFISKLGNDENSMRLSSHLEDEGVSTSLIFDQDRNSGMAYIVIDNTGENIIIVDSGANSTFSPLDLKKSLKVVPTEGIVLAQLEIPIETVIFASEIAKENGLMFVLNPAPAIDLSDELLQTVDVLVPNQIEASKLAKIEIKDIEDAEKAAKILVDKGVKSVVITLGSKGALICADEKIELISAPKVKAIDTTAAGDSFCGALVVGLSEGKSLHESVHFACHAASISVTRIGAQNSLPYRKELIV